MIKGSNETTDIEAKGQKVRFLGILLASLGSNVLANYLPGKVVRATRPGGGKIRAVKEELEWDRIFNSVSYFN